MKTTPPAGFDLAEFYKGIYLFQNWEIFPGVRTGGPKDVSAHLDILQFPADLSGMRVLEIAPWNGFFTFECVRRGAAEVVSFGPEDPLDTGYEKTRALLGIDTVRYVRGSVYDLSPDILGTFDVVLCLGLMYHLRHPLLALDRIYDVCTGTLYIDTHYFEKTILDRTIPEERKRAIIETCGEMHDLPLLYYSGFAETGDDYNWFVPNLRGFAAMVRSSGFDILHEANDNNSWCWLSARKGKRHFEVGLEGFNPHAASFAG